MAFQLPDAFSKELAESTKKVYTYYLNYLATGGYDTPASLVENADAVVRFIQAAQPGDDDTSRNKRRYFVSAVFWVLPERYRKTANPYSRLNSASMPSIFVSKAQWRAQQG